MDPIKILIPIDFSSVSEQAILMAGKLAVKVPVEIHLLYVIEPEKPGEGSYGSHPKTIELIRAKYNSLIQIPMDLNFHIKSGLINTQIHLAVSELEADLIIMGTVAGDDFTQLITGSKDKNIVENYKVPALRLRPETVTAELGLKNILLITDFEYFGDGIQINIIKRLAEAFNSTIHLLQIIRESDERYLDLIEAQMKFFAEEHNFDRFEVHLYWDHQTTNDIQKFDKEADMDIVCIRTQNKKNIERLLFGSFAERIVNKSTKPILTFKLKQYA